MTQTEDTHSYLTEEGDIPGHLDWNMEVEIREKEQDQESQISIRNLDWEYALNQSTRFIKETFPEFDTFYGSLDGQMDVGYAFDLKLGPREEIAVMSKMHPAVINHYVTSLIDDEVMAEACMVLKFKDQRTQEAVREYLRENGQEHPEELPRWGSAQPAPDNAL